MGKTVPQIVEICRKVFVPGGILLVLDVGAESQDGNALVEIIKEIRAPPVLSPVHCSTWCEPANLNVWCEPANLNVWCEPANLNVWCEPANLNVWCEPANLNVWLSCRAASRYACAGSGRS